MTMTAPDTAKPEMRTARAASWLNIAVGLLGPAVLFALFSHTVTDTDLWGHLRFGLDFLDSGRVIRPDIYSYTTGDQLWYNHEWLAEAVFAAIYRLTGATGLIWLKLLMATGVGVIMYRGLRVAQLAPLRAWAMVALSAVGLTAGMGTVRPHLFTYVAFAALLYILVRAEAGQTRGLIILPALFIIWTNSHGGFLAGVAVTILWTLTSLIRAAVERAQTGQWPVRRILIAAGTALGCLLATLVNPYGASLWRFLLETATVPRPEITEWQPILITSPFGLAYLTLIAVGSGALLSSRQSQRNLFRILGFIGFALAPLVAVRHTALFAIAMPLLVAPDLSSAWSRLRQRARTNPQQSTLMLLLAGVILTTAVLLGMAWYRGRCLEVDPKYYPVEAIEILRRGNATGNMAVHFNWGEYFIWQLGPGIQVSIDGRRETVYSEDTYNDTINFMYCRGTWDAVLSKYDSELALVPAESAAANLLRLLPGWITIHQDEIGALFVRSDSKLVGVLQAAEKTAPSTQSTLCFPSSRLP